MARSEQSHPESSKPDILARLEQAVERSPYDIAKAFIRPYVLRGDSIESLAASLMGVASAAYHAQIGGYAALPGHDTPSDFQTVPVRRGEVVVTRIRDTPCLHRFALADLYADLQGQALQPRLF